MIASLYQRSSSPAAGDALAADAMEALTFMSVSIAWIGRPQLCWQGHRKDRNGVRIATRIGRFVDRQHDKCRPFGHLDLKLSRAPTSACQIAPARGGRSADQ